MTTTLTTVHASLTGVTLVDVNGGWANFKVSHNKATRQHSLRPVNRSRGFGQDAHTEYATFYFADENNGLEVTGDYWRFIEGELGIENFIAVTARHGEDFAERFKRVFAQTDNDSEALREWNAAVAKADKESVPSGSANTLSL